jgi:Holliday junction DNA helicase RuvB
MSNYRADIVLGEGISKRTVSFHLKRFTLIGGTTARSLVPRLLRDQFKVHEHLESYSIEELATIVRVNARKLKIAISDNLAVEFAKQSQGSPRVANSKLTALWKS